MKIIPQKIKDYLNELWYKTYEARLKIEIVLFYLIRKMSKYKKEISYIMKYGISPIPYEYTKKYENFEIDVEYDKEKEKYFVLHHGKKLYFPKSWLPDIIINSYRQLLMEQDPESPHCYWGKENKPSKGDILIDVGAAEGMIALDCIDTIDYVYLIECEEQWCDALSDTFEAYKDKVEICRKYCGESIDENNDTIDNIVKEKDNSIIIKMDIEGAELSALRGAKQVLNRNNTKWAICTYHKSDDAKKIKDIFEENGIRYEYAQGYLLFLYGERLKYPYFRKGVIRGRK